MTTGIRCMAAALAAVVMTTGCGDGSELSATDQSKVSWAEVVLARHCADEQFAALGEDRAPEAKYENVLRAPGILIRIFRADPDATYAYEGEALTMRQLLSDRASDMAECAPGIAAELDRALAAG